MGDNEGEQPTTKKHLSSSSPKDPLDHQESTETKPPQHHRHHSPTTVSPPFISSTPLYSPNFDPSQRQQHFDPVNNPKRPRYTSAQWKPLPSSQQIHPQITAAPPPPQTAAAASSTETTSSPSHFPSPSPSSRKPEAATGEQQLQLRKDKYVSPVWKPNEMLWLARAWKAQYQGGGEAAAGTQPTPRGKTRAEKDREVAEFLNRHGVSRDAKTAGTKWDNMLGEFRKVFEWERGGEREQIGKSYFRLSPYERKLHRLPASFDEEVFEELSQFMGSKMRTSQGGRGVFVSAGGEDSRSSAVGAKALFLPPAFRDEDLPLSGRTRQITFPSGGDDYFHGSRGSLLGLESLLDISGPSTSTSSKELRRNGKVRMIWEESVSIWGEEGDQYHGGRVKVNGSNFLDADELTFLDDSMVAYTMEAFEDGPLKGFSVDRFVSGQQIKVFGRRKFSSSAPTTTATATSTYTSTSIPPGFHERGQLPSTEPSNIRSLPPWEFQDPTEYHLGCLRLPPPTLPTLLELSWHLQEPPQEELRFPLRKDVYRDLPQGRELFFTTTSELLDCRAITFDLLSPIIKSNPSLTASTASSRDSFIGLWDDCINRVVARFCSNIEMVRKSPNSFLAETIKDQWPNVTGFLRGFCLWRGEEVDQLREGQLDPSSSIVHKLFWSYADLPYVLGYYAVGYIVTFCALSRSQDRIIRTDLYTLDLSTPAERIKALVPCWRIAGLLPLLADRCFNYINNGNPHKPLLYTDFERTDLGNGNGNITETTPNTTIRYFPTKRKWSAVKEIYDFLDNVPHAEHILRSAEKDLALVFQPRGCKSKPTTCDQLIDALKHVTETLVALHDLSFMHRDLGWDKVVRGVERDGEEPWVVVGFDEAAGAPQIYPHAPNAVAGGRHAPEMGRGLHGVKVDVWGVGQMVKSCGLVGVPKVLRELQNRCLEQNPELRPTAADCYHHLMQLQSSLMQLSVTAAAGTGGGGGY